MTRFTHLAASTLLAVSASAGAADLGSEPAAMTYFKIPIGGSSHKALQPVLGLAMGRVQRSTDQPTVNLLNGERAPLLDLQFDGRAVSALRVNGIDALTAKRVHHADGSRSESTGGTRLGRAKRSPTNGRLRPNSLRPPGAWPAPTTQAPAHAGC